MANEEHLLILRQGVEVWNKWRQQNPLVFPDLSEANLAGTDLIRVDFSSTNLSSANLEESELDRADLRWTNFGGANLSRTMFFQANFTEANLSEACLFGANLVGANLSKAYLLEADLSYADLTVANLSRADLSRADLIETKVLGANFTEALLTGVCIRDWHINSDTQLAEVDCEYVYLKQKDGDRRPSDPNQNFVPGEFTKLFQKALSTVDLIFRNGVDWEAFAYSFRKVQVEQGDEELAIQSIENKGDGVLIVRLNVSLNADKGRIQGDFTQGYELAHKVLDERYRAELDSKSEEIYRQQGHINQLFFLLNQQQKRNQEIEKVMAETPKVNQTFNIQAPVHGFSGYTETFNNFSPEQKQNLAEAAAEIQQLLNQLAQTNPTSESAIVEAVHQEIRRNPTLKARLLGALKAGGLEALKAIFAHPVFSISAETVKGWLEAE